ncbi:endonuclease domain-containing protein [Streptomyces griseofuscus]|uniref:endonuclease domain-containing protein n=1 Tax=Streptomyces griseofuscus TaxID=146922 RepID=UPI00380CC107
MTSPAVAGRLLQELTEGCPVPAVLGDLSRYAFEDNKHLLIGDRTVRGYKYTGQWLLDRREVVTAGNRLAALAIDLDDLVDARLMTVEDERTWRSQITRWFVRASHQDQISNGCPDEEQGPCSRIEPTEQGLQCAATWDQAEDRFGRLTIAATRPLPLLTWSGTAWMIPRAYAALLDSADDIRARCTSEAARCTRCAAVVVDAWQWRVSTGYSVLCPSCAMTVAQPYQGHMQGRQYSSIPKNPQARVFLCSLCSGPQQALHWDHCHEHGFVRGPLCASCNVYEGRGSRFIRRLGAVRHVLRCDGCRRERTLPPRHRLDVIRLAFVYGAHGSCTKQPLCLRVSLDRDGSVRFLLWCVYHRPGLEWEQVVPASRVKRVVREFIETALEAGPTGRPAR